MVKRNNNVKIDVNLNSQLNDEFGVDGDEENCLDNILCCLVAARHRTHRFGVK